MSSLETAFVDRSVALDRWLAAHGPLSISEAMTLALGVCSRATNLPIAEFGKQLGSVDMAHIVRVPGRGWEWTPDSNGPVARVTDQELIERIGVVLYQCLTAETPAYPFPKEQDLRVRLRALRPELSSAAATLVVRAMTSGRHVDLSIAALVRGLYQGVGLEPPAGIRLTRRTAIVTLGAALILASAAIVGWSGALTARRVADSTGLAMSEIVLLDVTDETAQTLAIWGEYIAAIQEYQEIGRLWRKRAARDDPRPLWTAAHEAWVRTLRGDRLTTEQLLEPTAIPLSATLGFRHPYTRAIRLALAATLEARGATDQAVGLRNDANRATDELLGREILASDLLEATPAPPGVLAHTAPNAPEREGFRRRHDGGFFVPLTSVQRWLAGRDGWRLHVIATGACRTSVAIGEPPRLVGVRMGPDGKHAWKVTVDGAVASTSTHSGAESRLGISLVANPKAPLQMRIDGGELVPIRVDDGATPPTPPHALAFSGSGAGSGCSLVWLEIAVPFQPQSAGIASTTH